MLFWTLPLDMRLFGNGLNTQASEAQVEQLRVEDTHVHDPGVHLFLLALALSLLPPFGRQVISCSASILLFRVKICVIELRVRA